MKAANNVHIRKAGTKRTALAGMGIYDHRATIAGRPGIGTKAYPVWLMFKTGGLWYGHEKCKAGLEQTQECPDCGEKRTH